MGRVTVVGHRLEMGERTGQSALGMMLDCSFRQIYAAVIAKTAVRIQMTRVFRAVTLNQKMIPAIIHGSK